MGIFFVYILKASLCLAVFYLFYRLLLSRETFHRFNRLALLGVLVLSNLVPLIKVTTHEPSEVGQPFLSLEEMLIMAESDSVVAVEDVSAPFPWRSLLLLLYGVGVLFFMMRHLWSLGRMLRLFSVSRKENLEGGITLFVHDNKEVAPFSWMKNIAISKSDLEENGDAVLTHERAHIRNCHSWDLLLAEVCIFFQWFNPAAWLLKQELQNIHEFEADEWVIKNGIDAKKYQLLLIKKAVGARLYSIANSLNHSSLKKRITMMIKKKSNPWARLKYLYVLPLAAVAVAAFARPEVSNEFDEISNAKVNDLVSVMEKNEEEKEDSLVKTQWYMAEVASADSYERLKLFVEEGKKPLFIIDGKSFPSLTVDDVDAGMVESMEVLKAEEAVKKYGDKAKDGAVVLTSIRPEAAKVHTGVKFNVSASDEKFNLTGQVMDYTAKKPVPGASILVRGTTVGTLADIEGKFSLMVKKGDVLVVSYVGLQTQMLPIGGPANLVVWMTEDVQMMEEMLVVGYASDGEGASSVSHPDKKVVGVVDIPKAEPQKEEAIFQVVEEMPQFPGGMAEAMRFLGMNIKYPVTAQQAKIEGRVIVQFVIERDGSVSEVEILRGVSPELDAEAVRVVSMMPKWIPGKQRGKAVSVKYTMPITFRLQALTPEPKKEEVGAAVYQHINLKVDKDATQTNVDAVKDYLKNRNPYGEDGNTLVLARRGASAGKSTDSVLVVVDGIMKGYGQRVLNQVPIDQIQSISIMRNEEAKVEYGDKAKNGVIKITTKK